MPATQDAIALKLLLRPVELRAYVVDVVLKLGAPSLEISVLADQTLQLSVVSVLMVVLSPGL